MLEVPANKTKKWLSMELEERDTTTRGTLEMRVVTMKKTLLTMKTFTLEEEQQRRFLTQKVAQSRVVINFLKKAQTGSREIPP